jgi:hypothetical protein
MKIDWRTLLLFGGGLTLGNLMFDTKLAEVIGTVLFQLSGATSVWGITLGAIFFAILVSETSSNTASANMVVPVMIALALSAVVNPIPPAIGATLGASWGFMLLVSNTTERHRIRFRHGPHYENDQGRHRLRHRRWYNHMDWSPDNAPACRPGVGAIRHISGRFRSVEVWTLRN